MARILIDSCLVNIPRAQIKVSANDSNVINGNGVDCGYRSTLVYGHFISRPSGTIPGKEWRLTTAPPPPDIDLPAIGGFLARWAKSAAGSREFKGASVRP